MLALMAFGAIVIPTFLKIFTALNFIITNICCSTFELFAFEDDRQNFALFQ